MSPLSRLWYLYFETKSSLFLHWCLYRSRKSKELHFVFVVGHSRNYLCLIPYYTAAITGLVAEKKKYHYIIFLVLYSARWKSQINNWIFYASILRFPSSTRLLYLVRDILYVFGDFLALWMSDCWWVENRSNILTMKYCLGSLLINQIKLIVLNMTDYEAAHQIKTYSKRGTVFNLRLIFGPNLCLLPLILIWGWFLNIRKQNIYFDICLNLDKAKIQCKITRIRLHIWPTSIHKSNVTARNLHFPTIFSSKTVFDSTYDYHIFQEW